MRYNLFLIKGRVLNFIPEIISGIREGECYQIVQLQYDIFIRFLKYLEYKDNPKKLKHLLHCNQYSFFKRKAMPIIEKNSV